MPRTPEHLARLEEAIAPLLSFQAKQEARSLDIALEGLSVFWGENEDGEPYVEWAGGSHLGYTIRLTSFQS